MIFISLGVTERAWWGLAACCSKANKQARLVERKVCFISDARNCGGRALWTFVQRLTHHTGSQQGKSCYKHKVGMGGYIQKQHNQL